MSIALLPCPFCGGEPHIERDGTARVSMIIVCDDCGCTLESSDTMASAQFAGHGLCWNRRYNVALDTALKERNELRQALQEVISVADRKTDEFDKARAVLARTEPKP